MDCKWLYYFQLKEKAVQTLIILPFNKKDELLIEFVIPNKG